MKCCCAVAGLFMWALLACSLVAQNAPSTPTAVQPALPATPPPLIPPAAPAVAGPLQLPPGIGREARPVGKLNIGGIFSATGLAQGNHVPGDDSARGAVSNGQIFFQKTSGWWQFYVQAGAYNILMLGTPFLPTEKAISDL